MDILVGAKKSYIYKNMALYGLSNEPEIVFKARGRSIVTAVDALEILKREVKSRHPSWKINIAITSDSVPMKRQEQDSDKGDMINISEICIIVKRE